MPLPVQFRLLAHKDTGLKNAREILIRNMRGGLEGLGKKLRLSAQRRMREDTRKSKESLRVEVKGRGLGLRLEVYSTLIQAWVDAFGTPAGRFPPYRRGSRIFRWTERKARGIESLSPRQGKSGRVVSHLSRRPANVRTRIKRVKKASAPQGRRVATARSARERSIEKQAFLVARYIFEHGIRPSHWNKKALDANANAIIRELSNALSRAANEMSRG